MSPVTSARIQLLLAALLFSTGGAAIKATTFNAWQVAFLRCAIAAGFLLAVLPSARRNWKLPVVLTGITYAATLTLFVLANKLTTSANAIFLQDTAPLYLLILGPWLLKERFTKTELGFMGILAAGMALILGAEQQAFDTAPDPSRGNLVALASGITWALTLIGLRWAESRGKQGSGMATVAVGNLLAAVTCAPLAFPINHSTITDWLLVIYLGVFQIGLAYLLMTRGLRYVSALEASLLLFAEPALNPVWTWLVHGEQPALLALAGGGLILAATLCRAVQKNP